MALFSETWGAIGELHALTNSVRSIEHGILLVRCSSFGYSGVFHPSGHWNAFLPDAYDGDYEFVIPANFTRRWTLYSYIGETFLWICVVFAILSVGMGLMSMLPFSWVAQLSEIANRQLSNNNNPLFSVQ